jgi:hydroxyacylglutathione hydrolase
MNNIQYPIALNALIDNYIWVLHHPSSRKCMVVDPGESNAVLQYLVLKKATLTDILVTHHHKDHTDGIAKLQAHFPEIRVWGPSLEPIPYRTHPLKEGDTVSLWGNQPTYTVYSIPGHTADHIAYHDKASNVLFTGDTLFSAGCGRLFEGTITQLYHSLQRLKALPDKTQIYCGHEYTITNLHFAQWLEPENLFIQDTLSSVQACIEDHKPSLPASLLRERNINPFLRCEESSFLFSMEKRLNLSKPTPLTLFAILRTLKDNWQNTNVG